MRITPHTICPLAQSASRSGSIPGWLLGRSLRRTCLVISNAKCGRCKFANFSCVLQCLSKSNLFFSERTYELREHKSIFRRLRGHVTVINEMLIGKTILRHFRKQQSNWAFLIANKSFLIEDGHDYGRTRIVYKPSAGRYGCPMNA